MTTAPPTDSGSGSNHGSTLLQDMLREKKAQSQRVNKSYGSSLQHFKGHDNGLDDRNTQSSPLASMSARERSDSRRGSGVGLRKGSAPKEMGVREMEEVSDYDPTMSTPADSES